MENTQNRNDIYNFFKDMPIEMQREAIDKIQQQIKKPSDYDAEKPEGEVIPISQLCVK